MTKEPQKQVIVALGDIDAGIISPLLSPEEIFLPNPTAADLAVADAAIVRAAYRVDAEVLDRMPQLQVLARTGVGTELVDVAEAARRGIPVVITPGSNTNAVAEGVFAHLLTLVKRMPELHAIVRDNRWPDRAQSDADDLEGKTLGIVGYGRIGRRVQTLAEAFGMTVLVYDPIAEVPEASRVADLETLLASSDVVTLHLPLTEATERLFDDQMLSNLPAGAFLINCSRGGLVDQDAALRALSSGQLAGYGVDVFDPEPPVGHPLFQHPHVSLTPHLMGFTKTAMVGTVQDALRGAQRVLRGEDAEAVAVGSVTKARKRETDS